MKSLWMFILVAVFLWCSPASAEYCKVKSDGTSRTCIYKIDRIPHNSQIVISYTREGWTMMIAVFLKEFALIEGDAKVKSSEGGEQSIEYVSTSRDMTAGGTLMEAAIYKVSESLLRDLGHSKGKVRFYLAGSASKKDKEVEVAASLFSDIDAYIDETKTVLKALFPNE